MAKERIFSDIDFNLDIHPVTGDVIKVFDKDAVLASVKNLVLTEFYGRPFHPEIGSSVAGLLFEPFTPIVGEAIRITIEDVINAHEPRAEVEDVLVEFNERTNSLRVTIDVYLRALMQAASVDVVIERVR